MDLGIDIFGNPISQPVAAQTEIDIQSLISASAHPVPTANTQTTPVKQKGETVLVLDYANFFFRAFHMSLIVNPNVGDYTREEDLVSFGYKLMTDIVSIYNIFKPRHLVLAMDGKNAWRKAILPEEYKAQRVKDENVNWEMLFGDSNDIQKILHDKLGAIVTMRDHAEGDDMMCMIKECLWNRPEAMNIIIVSSDADLRQLIDFNKETSQYCIVYNQIARPKTKKRRLYINQDFKNWLEDDQVDIFFSNFDPIKNAINMILQNNKQIETYVENPNNVVLSKIFCGDDSDQVPSFYSYYRNGKSSRVTPSKYQKIVEMLNITEVKSLCEQSTKLSDAIEKVCKVRPDDIDIDERLMRQRKLVELNSELFPENIREYKETIEYMLRNNIPRVSTENLKAAEILANTKYSDGGKKKTLEAEVFRDFDRFSKSGAGVKAKQPTSAIDNEVLQEIKALF